MLGRPVERVPAKITTPDQLGFVKQVKDLRGVEKRGTVGRGQTTRKGHLY